MKVAVVTGASSGIGLEISEMLLRGGFRVYGIGRDFSKSGLNDPGFRPVVCDVTVTDQLFQSVGEIRKREAEIFLLVNNAGVGFFGPHEQLKPEQIRMMLATNLEAPILLTGLLLREIRKSSGFIINISSITATKPSPRGCAYAATKAGLLHFSRSLFEECRKAGVKVATICPDMTRTAFFDDLDFREGDEPESFITPGCVAGAVETVLTQRKGTVVTEMVLRPQRHMITKK